MHLGWQNFYFTLVQYLQHTPVLYVLPLANQLFYSKDFFHEKMQHAKIATDDANDLLFQFDLRIYGAVILHIVFDNRDFQFLQ